MNTEPPPQQIPRIAEVMPGAYYPSPYHHPTPTSHYHPSSVYTPFLPADPRIPGPIPITHAPGHGQKRLAQTQPTQTPAKKKQAKWSAVEDASIIELRGNGMKWEDISKQLPGRSAISCRLRFQNYLERRPEWDEEKKNKLARLYERFREDMWKGIAKEMHIPWRAAENMHWQMGELEISQRANVQPFQLAGQPPAHPQQQQQPPHPQRVDSPSSPPRTGAGNASSYYHHTPTNAHTHTHSLPTYPGASSPRRARADSATDVPASGPSLLPPLQDLRNRSPPPGCYALPPVLPRSPESRGR